MQSPAGWKLLVSELGSRGHSCVCVDLPVNEPDASTHRYADVITDAVRGMEAPIVIAHAAAGLSRSSYSPDRQELHGPFKSGPEMYCPDFPGKDPTKDPDLGPVSYISCADDRTIRPV
jgi:hypothetical protein